MKRFAAIVLSTCTAFPQVQQISHGDNSPNVSHVVGAVTIIYGCGADYSGSSSLADSGRRGLRFPLQLSASLNVDSAGDSFLSNMKSADNAPLITGVGSSSLLNDTADLSASLHIGSTGELSFLPTPSGVSTPFIPSVELSSLSKDTADLSASLHIGPTGELSFPAPLPSFSSRFITSAELSSHSNDTADLSASLHIGPTGELSFAAAPVGFSTSSPFTIDVHLASLSKEAANTSATQDFRTGVDPISPATPFLSGTDYQSLAKSLSDLRAHGRVVTSWAITYAASDSR